MRKRAPKIEIESQESGRSVAFTRYLATLPPAEAQRITDAEAAYLDRGANRRHAAARDFEESLHGVREDDPVPYKGFVV